jgi:hypothetical protein
MLFGVWEFDVLEGGALRRRGYAENRVPATTLEIPNPNFQVPNKFQSPIPKFPLERLDWDFEFEISLRFGLPASAGEAPSARSH